MGPPLRSAVVGVVDEWRTARRHPGDHPGVQNKPDTRSSNICRKHDVYICTPMCASACVVSSNIVYLGYEYRSMGISALNTEFSF